MGKKKKHRSERIDVLIYGIYHKTIKKILKVSISKEEMDLELGLGDYDENCWLVEIPITIFI